MKFKGLLAHLMSGSLGGITASRNKGGPYFRARIVPIDPNSPQQQAVRAILGGLANHWANTLTPAQRDAWDTYASLVPVLDAFGDPTKIPGIAMYVRCNTPRIQAGGARVDDGPTIYNTGEFTNPTFSYDTTNSEVDVSFTNTDEWASEVGASMLIYASRQQLPTINFFKNPYRYAGNINGAGTPPTSPAAITAPFPCAAGNRVFVRAIVTRADGRLSLPFRDYATGA